MKHNIFLLVIMIGLFLASCTDNTDLVEETSEVNTLEDQELINAIENDPSLKVAHIEALPSKATNILLNEYGDRYVLAVNISDLYGYKASLVRIAVLPNENIETVYFNKESRHLKSDPRETVEESGPACIEVQFPVSYVLADGSTVTGNSTEEIRSQLNEYYRGSSGVDQRPTLKFPVTVKKGDELIQVQSDSVLEELANSCNDSNDSDSDSDIETGRDLGPLQFPGTGASCFALIFPVTITPPGGDDFIANNQEELDKYSFSWVTDNPNSKVRPSLKYPFKVTFNEGVLTISDDSELSRVEGACDSDDGLPQEDTGDSEGEGDGDTDDSDRNG